MAAALTTQRLFIGSRYKGKLFNGIQRGVDAGLFLSPILARVFPRVRLRVDTRLSGGA